MKKNKYQDIRTDLLKILDKYKNMFITKVEKQELSYKLKEMFNYYNIDLQYYLSIDNYSITIIPIREIDKYALAGILSYKYSRERKIDNIFHLIY